MFEVHKLNEQGMELAGKLQRLFGQFLSEVEGISGAEGREMAIVRTHLETASFYAKRAMAMKSENHYETVG